MLKCGLGLCNSHKNTGENKLSLKLLQVWDHLTIDEATLNRRFGLFARVLVDVDLSEKLFESVIVEREGHALSIVVQYEKHPLFCAHCRNLGHSIHTC